MRILSVRLGEKFKGVYLGNFNHVGFVLSMDISMNFQTVHAFNKPAVAGKLFHARCCFLMIV